MVTINSVADLPNDIGSLVFQHLHIYESGSKARTCTNFRKFSELSLKRRSVLHLSYGNTREDGVCLDGKVYTSGTRTPVDAEAYIVPPMCDGGASGTQDDVLLLCFDCDKQCSGGCIQPNPIDALLKRCTNVKRILQRVSPLENRQQLARVSSVEGLLRNLMLFVTRRFCLSS